MALLGVQDLKRLIIPSGIDGGELAKWQLADGTTLEVVVSELATVLNVANERMMNDPIYAGLFGTTTEMTLEYQSGDAQATQARSEYGRGIASRVGSVGHTLPMGGFESPMRWTRDWLDSANMNMLRMDIDANLQQMESAFQRELLTRFFTSADTQINGGSGYDVAFANASDSFDYQPPEYDGQSFATTHTHFDRQADSAAGRATAISNGVDHLMEHGIMGPYHGIVPLVDVDDWVALASTSPKAEFVEVQRQNIRHATDSDIGDAQGDDRYIGYVNTARGVVWLWTTSRVPANYFGLYRSYGPDAMLNPLAVRFKERRGAGAYMLTGSNFQLYPVEGATILHDYGVGVGRGRLNGYAAFFDSSGSYADPTIS